MKSSAKNKGKGKYHEVKGKIKEAPKLKIRVKKGLLQHDPQPAAETQQNIPTSGIAMDGMPKESKQVYRGMYEGWFQIVRNSSGMIADFNRMFLINLYHFMDPSQRGRS